MKQLAERVNVKKVEYLLTLDSITGDVNKDCGIKALLQKYRGVITPQGIVSLYYRNSKQWRNYGRLYPHTSENGTKQTGMAMMKSDVRSFLAEDNYVDCDMKKCHAYILRYLFSKYKYNYRLIDDIINQFDDIKTYCDENKLDTKASFYTVINSCPNIITGSSESLLNNFPTLKEIHEVVYGPLLTNLQHEFSKLYKLCIKNEKNDTANNVEGRFISQVLQEYERRIVMKTIDFLQDNNIEIGSLIHDGFHINKKHEEMTVDLLPRIENILEKEYPELHAKFVIKPFKDHPFKDFDTYNPVNLRPTVTHLFDKSDYTFSDFREYVRNTTFKDYEDMVAKLLEIIPKVIYPIDQNSSGSSQTFLVKDSPEKIQIQTCPKFYLYYGDSSKTFLEFIMSSDIHKCFKTLRGIEFEPNTSIANPNCYNTFDGFVGMTDDFSPLDEDELKEIEPILHHLKSCICNDDDNLYDWLLCWFAHIIQKPNIKTKIVPIFYSAKQQAGKNIILSFISDSGLGRKYALERTGLDSITNDKNADLETAIMVTVNEASTKVSGWFVDHNKLKDLITNPRRRIRRLFVDAYEVNDYTNYVITSNSRKPVRIEQGDARFVAMEVSDRYVGNRQYFQNLGKCINNPTGNGKINGERFYRFLFNYTISRDIRDIPDTQLRQDIIGRSLDSPILFLRYITEEPEEYMSEIVGGHDRLLKESENVEDVLKYYIPTKKEFFHQYQIYCQMHDEKNRKKMTEFYSIIKDHITEVRHEYKRCYKLDSIRFD